MKLLKKLFSPRKLILFSLVFVFSLGIFLSRTGQVRAAVPIPSNSTYTNELYPPIGDVINSTNNPNMSLEKWVVGAQDGQGRWVQPGMILTVIDGLVCVMVGCPTSQSTNNSTKKTDNGALGSIGNLMGALYVYPAASAPRYVASVLYDASIISQPTYAQGFGLIQGSTGLDPILKIWQTARDIAYVFFVIIFVVIGFMIMFRQKIDPQTVASVQNSIPNIVVALILVTLSYALAGLIIDISNVATILFASALKGFSSKSILDWLPTMIGTKANVNIFDAMFNIGSGAAGSLTIPIQEIITNLAGNLKNVPLIGGMVSSLAALVLSFAVISAMFKTFFALISSYITIIFLTITSPLIFLSSALPGKGNAVTHWAKDMLANVLVFPAVFLFLYIGAIISSTTDALPWSTPGVTFPDAGTWVPFGLSGFGKLSVGLLIKYIIGFGIVISTPNIPGMIKEFLETKESALGAGTSQALQGTIQKIPIIGSMLG